MNLNINETDAPRYISLVREEIEGAGLKYFVHTFGCQQNEADSERIRGVLSDMGYSLSEDADSADIIIINTCAIREHAEMKALSILGRFKELRKRKPGLIIGVAGCMAREKHKVDMLKCDFHYVSFTMAPGEIHTLPRLVYSAMCESRRIFDIPTDSGNITEGLPVLRSSRHKAWVSIMYGCNNFCSYCIVPYVRGRERSRASSAIIEECRGLISDGCREITLLGQNVNSYCSDMNFPELISKIADIEGDFLIRFMTSHPKDVSDELINVMAERRDKIAPYFHLPLQSGSDRILERMNRTYDKEGFIKTALKLLDKVPNIALSTDVIIGFPGESEEDFEDTLDVLRRVRFDLVYSFLFSPRVGTPAAKMEGDVQREVMNDRMSRLLALQDGISLERSKRYENSEMRVLIDSYSCRDGKGILSGRTDTNKLVFLEGGESLVGSIVNTRIENARAFDLFGKIIN